MNRMQIYLPEDLQLELKWLAQKEQKATAQVIREVLEEGLKQKKGKKNAGDMLLELAALGGKGPKDLSKNFYEYAYGKKSTYAKSRRR